MARSLAPYIHVILADVVSIALYINKPLIRLTTAHYQSAVSMISFAQVLTAQWSDTIPCQNVWFQVRITSHDIPFQQSLGVVLSQSSHAHGLLSIQTFCAQKRKQQEIAFKDGYGTCYCHFPSTIFHCLYVLCSYPSTCWLGWLDNMWELGK